MNRWLLFNGLVGLFVLVGSYSVVWGGEKLDRACSLPIPTTSRFKLNGAVQNRQPMLPF